ncbi:MAG: hypothetical protein KC464_16900 [Myxococcales bacterium]|nr:hypothetical protein [Myxococcales bacterium]
MNVHTHPRLYAVALVVGGLAAVALVILLGGVEVGHRGSTRAAALVGFGGAAVGLGLIQLAWPPPPPTDARDDSGWFERASLGQKIVYVVVGAVGLLAAIVVQLVATGKY